MRITDVEVTHEVATPRARPNRDALQTLDGGGVVQVRITAQDGLSDSVSGVSSTSFGRLRGAPGVLAQLIREELAPEVQGEDPFLIRGIRDKLWRLTDYHGTAGLALLGISAVDIALWDLVGHALRQPVWRLLGAVRDRMPAYAMVGWLNFDVEELKPIAERAVAQGFRGVKMKVGAPTLEEDVARIEAVRGVVGPDLKLMVDANQVFSLPEALRRGRVYQELGCFWFEEPLRADDHAGLAELAGPSTCASPRARTTSASASSATSSSARRWTWCSRTCAGPGGPRSAWRSRRWRTRSTSPTPPTAAGPTCTSWRRCPTPSTWRAGTSPRGGAWRTAVSASRKGRGSAGRASTERSGPCCPSPGCVLRVGG